MLRKIRLAIVGLLFASAALAAPCAAATQTEPQDAVSKMTPAHIARLMRVAEREVMHHVKNNHLVPADWAAPKVSGTEVLDEEHVKVTVVFYDKVTLAEVPDEVNRYLYVVSADEVLALRN